MRILITLLLVATYIASSNAAYAFSCAPDSKDEKHYDAIIEGEVTDFKDYPVPEEVSYVSSRLNVKITKVLKGNLHIADRLTIKKIHSPFFLSSHTKFVRNQNYLFRLKAKYTDYPTQEGLYYLTFCSFPEALTVE